MEAVTIIPNEKIDELLVTWQPTNKLRWKHSWTEKRILEQLWQGSDGSQDWVRVPDAKED